VTAYDWVLIGWWGLGTLLTISLIGRKRDPITPGQAMWVLILNVTLTVGMLMTRGVL
jgi:hypothetical protein